MSTLAKSRKAAASFAPTVSSSLNADGKARSAYCLAFNLPVEIGPHYGASTMRALPIVNGSKIICIFSYRSDDLFHLSDYLPLEVLGFSHREILVVDVNHLRKDTVNKPQAYDFPTGRAISLSISFSASPFVARASFCKPNAQFYLRRDRLINAPRLPVLNSLFKNLNCKINASMFLTAALLKESFPSVKRRIAFRAIRSDSWPLTTHRPEPVSSTLLLVPEC